MTYWIALAITIGFLLGLGPVAFFLTGHKLRPFVKFTLRYIAVFALLLLVESLVVWLFPSFHLMLRRSAATIVGGLLRLAGADLTVAGSILSVGEEPLLFDVTVACLGGLLFWVYIGLVWAESGATLEQRVRGILAGLAVLLGFNVFRMTFSIYLEQLTGKDIHDYFYFFNMFFVLLIWAVWLRTLKPKAADSAGKWWGEGIGRVQYKV